MKDSTYAVSNKLKKVRIDDLLASAQATILKNSQVKLKKNPIHKPDVPGECFMNNEDYLTRLEEARHQFSQTIDQYSTAQQQRELIKTRSQKREESKQGHPNQEANSWRPGQLMSTQSGNSQPLSDSHPNQPMTKGTPVSNHQHWHAPLLVLNRTQPPSRPLKYLPKKKSRSPGVAQG